MIEFCVNYYVSLSIIYACDLTDFNRSNKQLEIPVRCLTEL